MENLLKFEGKLIAKYMIKLNGLNLNSIKKWSIRDITKVLKRKNFRSKTCDLFHDNISIDHISKKDLENPELKKNIVEKLINIYMIYII